jgi:hypothetical protein
MSFATMALSTKAPSSRDTYDVSLFFSKPAVFWMLEASVADKTTLTMKGVSPLWTTQSERVTLGEPPEEPSSVMREKLEEATATGSLNVNKTSFALRLTDHSKREGATVSLVNPSTRT